MTHIKDIYGVDPMDLRDPYTRGRAYHDRLFNVRASVAIGNMPGTIGSEKPVQRIMIDLTQNRPHSREEIPSSRICLDAKGCRELAHTLLEAADVLEYQQAVKAD